LIKKKTMALAKEEQETEARRKREAREAMVSPVPVQIADVGGGEPAQARGYGTAQKWAGASRSRGADVGGGRAPVPAQMWEGRAPVPVQMRTATDNKKMMEQRTTMQVCSL
jgi:hypothetical protein